jgi:hypothetical protein
MATVTQFFEKFPKVNYDINRRLRPEYENVTDIFFRIGVLRTVLNNTSSYVVYEIAEGDTPDVVAQKVYEDPGAAWMIIYANNILDPQFDWPLDSTSFDKMIISKYGSIASSKTTYHHYEKIIERTVDDVTTVYRYVINKERLTENDIDPPYNYYDPYSITTFRTADSSVYKADSTLLTSDVDLDTDVDITRSGSLAKSSSLETFNINGKTVIESTYGAAISNYDYEQELNDNRRTIKVIKKEYYDGIQIEFNNIVKSSTDYVRRLI